MKKNCHIKNAKEVLDIEKKALDYGKNNISQSFNTALELILNNTKNGIVLMGVNPKTTIVDGSKTNRALLIDESPNNVIKNLTFQNGVNEDNASHGAGGINISHAENTTLENLILRNNY